MATDSATERKKNSWLTRNVVAIGLVSLFSDLGHETATTILPVFLATLGAAPWALGVIEGVSDALSSFSKLWSGWFCDRSGKRKPVAVAGYVLTGVFKATIGLATSWWHVLFSRSARTMTIDPKTHDIYLSAAEFGPPPAPTSETPHPRPPMIKDSFVILVVGK